MHFSICIMIALFVVHCVILKASTERRNWTELNWNGLNFWQTGQWVSLLVIGWRVRERNHVDHHRRHLTVPTVMHYCLPVGQFVKN